MASNRAAFASVPLSISPSLLSPLLLPHRAHPILPLSVSFPLSLICHIFFRPLRLFHPLRPLIIANGRSSFFAPTRWFSFNSIASFSSAHSFRVLLLAQVHTITLRVFPRAVTLLWLARRLSSEACVTFMTFCNVCFYSPACHHSQQQSEWFAGSAAERYVLDSLRHTTRSLPGGECILGSAGRRDEGRHTAAARWLDALSHHPAPPAPPRGTVMSPASICVQGYALICLVLPCKSL